MGEPLFGRLVMRTSGIITLLTDFGVADPYVAMMKGVILSINPKARLVDITHEIPAGAVFPAARMLRETYRFFPPGTIHLGVVDPGVGSDRKPIAAEAGGHGFVGPDNGLFYPILQEAAETRITHLKETRFFLPAVTSTFHGRDVFAPVAAYFSLGIDPDQMGIPMTNPEPMPIPAPRLEEDSLHGQVIHVDHFGNLISNIGSEALYRFLGSSNPSIRLGKVTIRRLSHAYSDVDEGQLLAYINSSNLLEVAVNRGRASEYMGLEKESLVGMVISVTRD